MTTVFSLMRRHAALSQLLLSSTIAVCIAIYVNLITGEPQSKSDLQAGRPDRAISQMGWSNFWILAALGLMVCQAKIARPRRPSDDVLCAAITDLLQAATRALIYPKRVDQAPVRAFCHIADRNKRILRPYCTWSFHQFEDRDAQIPYEGPDATPFVIARAFNQKRVVVEPISSTHLNDYSESLKEKIWPELQCVAAAPIRDFQDADSEPLGTIALDSSLPLSALPLDRRDAKDILSLIAHCVYILKKAHE